MRRTSRTRGIPPADYAEAAQKYGINKGQFLVKPLLSIQYFAFNHDRPLFKGAKGTDLAKAINYAIDRKAILAQAGYLAGKRTDQILPPGSPGFKRRQPVSAQGPGHRDRKEVGGEVRREVGNDACELVHLETVRPPPQMPRSTSST